MFSIFVTCGGAADGVAFLFVAASTTEAKPNFLAVGCGAVEVAELSKVGKREGLLSAFNACRTRSPKIPDVI